MAYTSCRYAFVINLVGFMNHLPPAVTRCTNNTLGWNCTTKNLLKCGRSYFSHKWDLFFHFFFLFFFFGVCVCGGGGGGGESCMRVFQYIGCAAFNILGL